MFVRCSCGALIPVFPERKQTRMEVRVLEFLHGQDWVNSTDLLQLGKDFDSFSAVQFATRDLLKQGIIESRAIIPERKRIRQFRFKRV